MKNMWEKKFYEKCWTTLLQWSTRDWSHQTFFVQRSEAAVCRCSLKVPSVRRQSPVLESIFKKVTKLKTGNCIKEETPLQNKFFSVSFTKFLRTTFFKELLRWLLRNDFQKIFKTKFFQKLGALASENSL